MEPIYDFESGTYVNPATNVVGGGLDSPQSGSDGKTFTSGLLGTLGTLGTNVYSASLAANASKSKAKQQLALAQLQAANQQATSNSTTKTILIIGGLVAAVVVLGLLFRNKG